MSQIINPLTGRLIRVGGTTFTKLYGLTTKRRGGSCKVGGELMVDRERWLKPTSRQKRMVAKSMWSNDTIVQKGAKRSLKGHYRSRPSPPMSATLFTEGSRERGNDGRIWKISTTRSGTKRWTPL